MMAGNTEFRTRIFPLTALVLAISLAGCSGSSDISQPLDGGNGGMESGDGSGDGDGSGGGDGSDDGDGSGGGGDGAGDTASSTERVLQDVAGASGAVGSTVTTLGARSSRWMLRWSAA